VLVPKPRPVMLLLLSEWNRPSGHRPTLPGSLWDGVPGRPSPVPC
jgi:hypothetical protein